MCLCLCGHLCHVPVEVRGQLVTASALLLWDLGGDPILLVLTVLFFSF